MEVENLNLKRSLILQSFAPLFLLLVIKYLDINLHLSLIGQFITLFVEIRLKAFIIAVKHPEFGGLVVSFISIVWLIATIVIALGFNGIQKAGFRSEGEK